MATIITARVPIIMKPILNGEITGDGDGAGEGDGVMTDVGVGPGVCVDLVRELA